MIVGNGLIANECSVIDRPDVLFFASGVSNSMNNDENNYIREILLVKSHLETEKKFIYFSSIDEYIINERYLKHKKQIEELIKNKTNNYIIIKIPQLLGKRGNSNNFINYIYNHIKNDIEFDLFLTKRSLLDVSDLIEILKELLKINYVGLLNINYIELMSVSDFIVIIENILGKSSKIKNVVQLEQVINDNTEFVNSILELSIHNPLFYNKRVIEKYFTKK